MGQPFQLSTGTDSRGRRRRCIVKNMLIRGTQLTNPTTNLFPDDIFIQIHIDIVKIAVHVVTATKGPTLTIVGSSRSFFVVVVLHIIILVVTPSFIVVRNIIQIIVV